MENKGWGLFYDNTSSLPFINNQAGAHRQRYTCMTQEELQEDRPGHSVCAKAGLLSTTSLDTPQ